MAEAIVYCDACGRMIPPSELARGEGLVLGTTALCRGCLAKLSPEQRAMLAQPPAKVKPAPSESGRKRTPPPEHAKLPSSSRTLTVLAATGLVAGLLAGVAVGLVFVKSSPAPAPQMVGSALPQPVPATTQKTPVTMEHPPVAAEPLPKVTATPQPPVGAAERPVEDKMPIEELARKALSDAVERSEALADDGKFEEALETLKGLEGRFASSEWFSTQGRKHLEEALERLKVRRERAQAEAAEREKARAREEAWREFVPAFLKSGAEGLERAKDFLERESPRLRELGLSEKLSWFEARLREAAGVESLIEDGLRGAKGLIRLRLKDKSVAGSLAKIEQGRIWLKPVLGNEIELSLAEVVPLSLVQAAGLLRPDAEAAETLRVASYLISRGDLESAAKAVSGLVGARAEDFRRKLGELSALCPEGPPEPRHEAQQAEAAAKPPATAPEVFTPTGEDVTEGLLAYFKFDEGRGTAISEEPGIGSKQDGGTIQGNGSEGAHWRWTEGKFGSALSFSPDRSGGVGKEVFNHVALADGEIRWSHKGSHTLTCWVKFPEKMPPPHGGGLVRAAGWSVGLACTADAKGYYFSFSATFDEDYKIIAAADREPRKGGVWYHVAGACDVAARKLRLYVDGLLVDEKDFPSPGQSLTGGPNGWNIGANQPGTWWNDPVAATIDEVRFYNRALSPAEVAEIYSRMDREIALLAKTPEERKLLMAESVGRPASEGYSLDVRTLVRLAMAVRKGKAIPKKLAEVGGGLAASPAFGAALRKALKTADGYSFASSTGLAASSLTIADARKGLWRHIERERPELVRICFDATELARGRPVSAIKADLAELTEKLLDWGTAVVLYTIPIRQPQEENAKKLILEYNAVIAELAARLRVPVLDAYTILNSEAESGKGVFTPAGIPSQNGFDILNEKFLRLYRVIERWAMGRQR